jgi:hypothetical protein
MVQEESAGESRRGGRFGTRPVCAPPPAVRCSRRRPSGGCGAPHERPTSARAAPHERRDSHEQRATAPAQRPKSALAATIRAHDPRNPPDSGDRDGPPGAPGRPPAQEREGHCARDHPSPPRVGGRGVPRGWRGGVEGCAIGQLGGDGGVTRGLVGARVPDLGGGIALDPLPPPKPRPGDRGEAAPG